MKSKDISHFVEKCYNQLFNIFRTETISFLATKIWELVPDSIKNATSLELFKKQVKLWATGKCPCRLCNIHRFIHRFRLSVLIQQCHIYFIIL